MKRPILQDDAFLADVHDIAAAAAPFAPSLNGAHGSTAHPVPRSAISLWWLGQSGYLVHYQGSFLLLDPYLSDSLTRKYAATDKPHVRISERVVDPARLGFVQCVTSSHIHTDHLDPDTLRPLAAANPNLFMVCPEAIRAAVRERSGLPDERITGLDVGATTSFLIANRPPFQFHAIPAAHESFERDASGRMTHLGYVLQVGPYRIYHSGDTVRFSGMAELLRPFRIDIALLPINGRSPERRVAGNLWGREAAALARDLGARLAIPCHYDLFAFNTVTPDEFIAECRHLNQPFHVLQQGERLSLDIDPQP
jgi:L-ascorbate metabolism protein UlaG (beta-lactamase superfamily)